MTAFDQPGSFHIADAVLARWQHDPHALVQVLRETQAQTHWLPRELLAHIAAALHLTLAHVEGVASFYRFFHLKSVGRVRVLFSDNITDRMAGSDALMERLCERLGVAPGEVDAQGRFSVDRCSCTGLCDQGPALLVNHRQVVTRLDAARIDQLAERLLAGVPPEGWPADWFAVEDNIRRADVLLQGLPAQAPSLPAVLAREPAELLAEVERAGLRGRGGAGFPTARKWRACAEADAPDGQRCVVCNADEGEPGTFKDRVLLTRMADVVFEGMTLAAWAVARGRASSICAASTAICWNRCARRSICAGQRIFSDAAYKALPASISTSRSISVPAPMSVARKPPCSNRWRASVARRVSGHRSR